MPSNADLRSEAEALAGKLGDVALDLEGLTNTQLAGVVRELREDLATRPLQRPPIDGASGNEVGGSLGGPPVRKPNKAVARSEYVVAPGGSIICGQRGIVDEGEGVCALDFGEGKSGETTLKVFLEKGKVLRNAKKK